VKQLRIWSFKKKIYILPICHLEYLTDVNLTQGKPSIRTAAAFTQTEVKKNCGTAGFKQTAK